MPGKKPRKKKWMRFFHKWPSVLLSLFVLIFVLSGIVMNHRGLFSGIDVSRDYLLRQYRYENWNNAAVKGACRIGTDSLLVYGNIGVWHTDTNFSVFSDFNNGFPTGIDNRKVHKVCLSGSQGLMAGTLFGLFRYDTVLSAWKKQMIPGEPEGVVDLVEAGDRMFVMTRSRLYEMKGVGEQAVFSRIELPPPVGYQNQVGLFRTLWVIHSGEIGGWPGKLFVDLMGLALLFLSLSGLVYWLFPRWIRQLKKQGLTGRWMKWLNRFSIRWHNKIGVWTVAFLLVTTVTGMFLRPPLLIAIAQARVGKIPFTVLDSPNPWHDQLRRILYDHSRDVFIVGTNSGIYAAEPTFTQPLFPFGNQPPLSVMGINVFEQQAPDRYLVGSFNGLYLWDPFTGRRIDYISPQTKVQVDPAGPPLSENMIAGYICVSGQQEYAFDYNRGMEALTRAVPLPEMPGEIKNVSPMSLWNLALEVHTGRYYSFLFGKWYILFIPLFGMSMIVILLTGLILWLRKVRKVKKNDSLI